MKTTIRRPPSGRFQQGVAFDVRGFQVDGVVGPVTRQALVTEVLAG